MTDEIPYKDGTALWAAVKTRAKTEAAVSGLPAGALLRRFVVDRFLARVFALPGNKWVLKGGNAVLTRVHDARTTKDIDLLAELADLDAAVERLREAIQIDLGDHFRFAITDTRAASGGTMQPDVDGYKVSIDAYCGVTPRHRFSVDIVTGSLMTTEPDTQTRPGLVPAIPATSVRLYPVVDHIADKLCATQSTYGTAGDQPSSRVRDLVDLVVFARTQRIDGTELADAIAAECAHRGLPGVPVFSPPEAWRRLYPTQARAVPACGDVLTFDGAVDLTRALLDPALDRTATGRQWSPDALTWARA
ncbi:histidinol-phosphate/aromatic aminotransferase and cobyric acid decarboxylase [Microbacterium testaceum StLB037]|uniref:Histidinol-phosphate/aromatic aminotransferase and cobyric acid decarboxylase n=1 Tax=Microbacterium testaceum (strain StLB037) TaxID=979556 RepID=E8N8Z3_MICTS|nr:nucleotidyl transferase AbiEii/AbiGii toxin family protein [Microbacterium testaceum]BAJ73202.1 histidinol-phosphate/aromatic aminotransferase and cobyric acid decarboxylase [Microbacterium testaceum StLB037]